MNLNPYLRLLWKEYRSIRLFWCALIVLTLLAQGITIALAHNSAPALAIVFNLALAAPVLFALGYSGTAYALEHEEGTIEFLRAAPVSAIQLFAGKLTLAAGATLLMYLVLLPLAYFLEHSQLPKSTQLQGMLGLWIAAAPEAIAWGLLFSLLNTRPLIAICLAIFAGSTMAHVLAWSVATAPNTVVVEAYGQAVPYRAAVVFVVLAVDVLLALRWLDAAKVSKKQLKPSAVDDYIDLAMPMEISSALLSSRPDRSAMWGHLFWQHYRQSRWLMLMFGLVGPWFLIPMFALLFSFLYGSFFNVRSVDFVWIAPLSLLISLVGSCVFLPDQEQRRYRFFVEHNIPSRYLWFTRQLPWMLVTLLISAVWCFFWLRQQYQYADWWRVVERFASEPIVFARLSDNFPYYVQVPPIMWMAGCIAVSYAAGQWASMHIRSSIMAGFCGLVLSGILCGWVTLMDIMKVNWLWSVAPIPLVLLWATWLRAPDWVRENTSLIARLKATVVVLIPATVLLIAVPYYRVHQIPPLHPGFDPQEFLSHVTPEALATADLYQRASLLDERPPIDPKEGFELDFAYETTRPPSKAALNWLHANSRSLNLVLEASRRPSCLFINPRKDNYFPALQRAGFISLVLLSGRELEAQGKLDEALDRYFSAFQCVWHLSEVGERGSAQHIFRDLKLWSAAKDQTPQRIRAALQRLQTLDDSILRLDEELKMAYVIVEQALRENSLGWFLYHNRGLQKDRSFEDTLWGTLMPWERTRAIRLLNLLTNTALLRLRTMREDMNNSSGEQKGIVWYVPRHPSTYWSLDTDNSIECFSIRCISPGSLWSIYWRHSSSYLLQKQTWLNTTWPTPIVVGNRGLDAALWLASFESNRRATIITLALEAYRLEKGKVPESLDQLVGTEFDTLPLDPYSGHKFLYFPQGIPIPENSAQLTDLDLQHRRQFDPYISFGMPGIWCTGPELEMVDQRDLEVLPDQDQRPSRPTEYYLRDSSRYTLSGYAAWLHGQWFPIPEKR